MAAKVSILVICWNNDDELEVCLNSVLNGLNDREVIVVDICSPGKTLNVPEKFKSRIKLLRNEASACFSSAANLGIRESGGDLVLLLNADWMA